MDDGRAMFDCESLPDDNSDLASVVVDLPRLADDSPSRAPATMDELLAYLKLEVDGGGALTSSDLTFRRTVDLGEAQYWVWSFVEPVDGAPAYVTVRLDAETRTLSYDPNYYDLAPEQFVVAEHCGCW